MAKLTDPDSYTYIVNATATTEEIEIQTAAKTIELRLAGNLNDDAPGKTSGGTAKSVYSKMKEAWLANAVLRRHRFPLKMIFEGSFIWVNGWQPQGDQTRDLFRDAGFLEQVTGQQNSCSISLGAVNAPASDLAYYQNVVGFTSVPINYDKTGELNENILIHDGGVNDYTDYQKHFMRIQGKQYAEYNLLTEQGLAVVTYQAYRFPLENPVDLKVTTSDGDIDTLAPYTGMKINYLKGTTFDTAAATTYVAEEVLQDGAGRWFFVVTGGTVDAAGAADYTANGGTAVLEAYDGEFLIGSVYYAGNRVVTCNNGTAQEVHEYCQRQLRLATDINADDTTSLNQRGFGSVNGNVGKYLTEFVGDNLKPAPGVVLVGFDTNSTNNIQHSVIDVDSGGLDAEFIPVSFTEVAYPFVAAGNFLISDSLVDEPDVDTVLTAYHDYVTTTTNTDIGISGASGQTAVLEWTGTTLDHLVSGDWLVTAGFSNAGNNGVWEITGAVDTGLNTAAVTKRDLTAPVNEAATPSVTVDQNPFDTPGAVIVTDNSSVDIDFTITAASIPWDFDYTFNNDGGRTPNQPAPITIVAVAKDGAEWTIATHTITAATGQNITINAPDELNYANP